MSEFGDIYRTADGFQGYVRGVISYDDGSRELILRNELSGPPDAPHLEERVVAFTEVERVDTE